MSNKGQVLIGLTTLMLIALMIYFLVAASQEISTAGRTDTIGEYQIKIANGIYHQKEGENYFYLSSKNAMLLALYNFYIESHEKICENFVDPLFNNCKVDYEIYLKKEFENSMNEYLGKHDYVNNIKFNSKIEYDDTTETIETEVITGDSIISITTNDQGFCNSYLTQYHSYSSASNYEWKLTEEGLKVKDSQNSDVIFQNSNCAQTLWNNHKDIIKEASKEHSIPEQVIISTVCTEAHTVQNPASPLNVRCEDSLIQIFQNNPDALQQLSNSVQGVEEVYYCHKNSSSGGNNCDGDQQGFTITYYKYACSTGLAHMLPDTARIQGFTGHVDELILPDISIPLAAKYLSKLNKQYGLNYDPILLAAAYNKGRIQETNTYWGVFTFTQNPPDGHLFRAAGHFSDAVSILGSYCSEDQLLGDLIFQQSFKINNSYNPEIFQPIYDFVEEVLYNHETEEAMEQLEYNVDNFNQGSYNIMIENAPCAENSFTKFYENLYFCLDSPHDSCYCNILNIADGELNMSITKTANEVYLNSKNFSIYFDSNVNNIRTENNYYYLNFSGLELNTEEIFVKKDNSVQLLEQPHSNKKCITDTTIQRLCAKLDTPIYILDNIITEIPFDIEYYAKPKSLEHVEIEFYEDSFIVSWNAPQNRAYWYYIYNSEEQITNSNLQTPIWAGIGEFTQFPENNKLFLENNRIQINITGSPLPFTSLIQENTKGLKSRVS